MRSVWRLVFFAIVVAVLLVVAAPSVLGEVGELRDTVPALLERESGPSGQSAAQVSAVEFTSAPQGLSPAALRARIGEPESSGRARVEGLELECWYYGIAGASGAYQFCFENGKLRTKLRFGT
jgi:hypothetical protein